VQARVRRDAFSLSIYERYVATRRDAMQRDIPRGLPIRKRIRAVRICVQTSAVFRRSLGIARISKSMLFVSR